MARRSEPQQPRVRATAAPAPISEEDREGVRTFFRLAMTAARLLEEGPLSPAQYRLLAICAEEPVRAAVLADRLALTRPTISVNIDRLEERKYIRRKRSATDGRGVEFHATAAGRRALEQSDRIVLDLLHEVASPRAVRRLLLDVLEVRAALDDEFHRLSGQDGEGAQQKLLPF